MNKELPVSLSSNITENGYNEVGLSGSHSRLPQVESPVEPYELVELFYGSNPAPISQQSQTSIPTNSIVQERVSVAPESYKCELCNRSFKEASHFYKHKRGALCRKAAMKLARKNKKKTPRKKESTDKKSQFSTTSFKPYQCSMCGSKFYDKVNVELHLERTHATQQPLWTEITKSGGGFACSDCDLWFTDRLQLKQHQVQHATQGHSHLGDNLIQQNLPVPPQPPAPFYSPHMQSFPQNLHHGYHQMPPAIQQPTQSFQQVQPNPQGHHHLSPFMVPHPPHQIINSVSIPSTYLNVPVVSSNNSVISPQENFISSSASSEAPKNSKLSPFRNPKSSSLTNVCGDCGHKFVDIINLELHMQRKHPKSQVLETVELNGGVTFFKTNNSNNNTLNGNEMSIEKKSNNFYECILCSHKESSLSDITSHLQKSHDTTQAHFVNLVDLSESKRGSVKYTKYISQQRSASSKEIHKCSSCSNCFPTKAELGRHRIKDKNVYCGICSFASCSNSEVTSHVYSCHKDTATESLDLSSPNTSADLSEDGLSCDAESSTDKDQSSPTKDGDEEVSKLNCCICDFSATSGVSLAEHLESHDSVTVKCGKCDESRDSFMELTDHINTYHGNEIIRVTLSMKNLQTPCVYMFLITPRNFNKPNNSLVSNANVNSIDESLPIYACSSCCACLRGKEVEEHSERGCLNTSFTIGRQNSVFSALSTTESTVEFRCEECGFWRERSCSVMEHIKSVHISANMIHSQTQDEGNIINTTIHVFTPISSMAVN